MLVCSPVVIAQPLGAAQPKKLRLAFSAFAYANPPFWIAHELKLFEKYGGYETELVYVGGSRPIQAMLGGSIDVSQVGGAAAVAAAAQGRGDFHTRHRVYPADLRHSRQSAD